MFGIPHCDTVKKARQWFAEQGVPVQFHDFKKQGLESQALQEWLDALGWEAVLNRKGTTWRKLDEQVQQSVQDAASAKAVLLAHHSAIKRPVVCITTVDGQRHFSVGFVPAAWQDWLQQ